MGRGNVCVFQEYEGLFYIDNDDLHEYRCYDDVTGETEYRKQGELSYEDLTGCHWKYDEYLSQQNWEDAMADFVAAMKAKFPKFVTCDKWISNERHAILENNLFYIAVSDNEWSMAVMLIRKDHWCYDFSGLQKQHYQRYLDGIRDCLFEQFETLGIYGGAWTSGRISRSDFQKGGEQSA